MFFVLYNIMIELIKKKTITSLEISELTSKPHNDLLKSIRNMEEAWVKLGQGKFSLTSYTDKSNRQSSMYELNKTECLYIATKFNDEARAMLILRWEKLEKQHKLPTTFAEALRLAAEQSEQLEVKTLQLNQAEETIKVNEPKVVFANTVMGSTNSILIRQFAKDLCDGEFKIGQNKLFEWFRDNKYINKSNEPYQNYIEQGLFEVITRSIGSGSETFTSKTTKISGKGQVYFAKKIKQQ